MVVEQEEALEHMSDIAIHQLPAYLIEWQEKGKGNEKQYLQRPVVGLRTPQALSSCLQKRKDDKTQRLYVFHGMRPDFLSTLLEIHEIEADFSEACASRKRHPTPLTDLSTSTRGIIWEYPELVSGGALPSTTPKESDLMKKPPAFDLPASDGKLSIIFCRASLWQTANPLEHVLFLDKAPTKPTQPSFESLLLLHSKTLTSLPSLFSSLIHNHWLALLDSLSPPAPPTRDRNPPVLLPLYWQILHSIELNPPSSSAWTNSLVAKVERRISLLSLAAPGGAVLSPVIPAALTSPTDIIPHPTPPPSTKPFETATLPLLRRHRRRQTSPWEPPKDENQRSLDRISYLGGIFLPIPIVSGILSMGDEFGPTGSKFWLFWAVAIPLSLLGILIIYADTVRKMQVWVEVKADEVLGVGSGLPSRDVSLAVVPPGSVGIAFDGDQGKVVMDEESGGGQSTTGGGGRRIGLVVDEEKMIRLDENDVIIERLPEGDRAWKMEELGWLGALKGVVWRRGKREAGPMAVII